MSSQGGQLAIALVVHKAGDRQSHLVSIGWDHRLPSQVRGYSRRWDNSIPSEDHSTAVVPKPKLQVTTMYLSEVEELTHPEMLADKSSTSGRDSHWQRLTQSDLRATVEF